MNRASLALATCLTVGGLVATGCGGPKEFGSICATAPAPAECQTACDPLPGAANSCPTGYYCAPDGKCDAQCTATGGECGDGYVCTADGRCESNDNPPPPPIDAACPAVVFTPMPTTPSIALILDGSGSMNGTDITPTRYRAMTSALTGANGVVTGLETKAYFGSHIYSCQNGGNYRLDSVPRALNNAAAINTSITAFTPGGNTPTPTAITDVTATFTTNPPPAGSPPVIVLATDGLPNQCAGGDTQAQSVAAAAAAYAAGIPVYILAINQQSQHFQDMANAGQGWTAGQPNIPYYPVSNATQLAAAFQTIINGVISCDLMLTSSIDAQAAMQGTVTINGMPLTYGSDWTLVGGNTVHLEAGACATLKSTTNPQVSATFPCGAVIL